MQNSEAQAIPANSTPLEDSLVVDQQSPSLVRNSKKRIIIIGVALLFFGIVLGILAARFLPTSRAETTPTPTPSVMATPTASPSAKLEDTSDWQTYTNSTYGFSFKYPQDWDINESLLSNGESCIDVDTAENIALLKNRKQNTEGPVFPFFVCIRASKPNYFTHDFESVTKTEEVFAGEMATVYARKILMTNAYGSEGDILTAIVIQRGQKYIEITQSRSSDTPGMFGKILYTFKLNSGNVKLQHVVLKDGTSSLEYPSDWILTDKTSQVDIYQDGKINWAQNIIIEKDGYVITSINPLTWGPNGCVFPDSKDYGDQAVYGTKYSTYTEFMANDRIYRRTKSTIKDDNHQLWVVCSAKRTVDGFGSVAGFGSTSYSTPLQYDEKILSTMDNIVTSFKGSSY